MDDFAIKTEKVSKIFKLPLEKNSSMKSVIINFYKHNKDYEKQHALSGISLEIKKSEFFGIVGRNGSGKSTLLKLLAGIYSPTSGQVHVRGSLTPFIELGVGFNAELTGRENIYLNGALLGFNRKEMKTMYKDIVKFAELERFMDQKLKNYSSGMQVRLAFSIAIRAKSDILLIDEVLAVGDAAFQRKCFDYFEELKKENKTVILVSHDMDSVKRFCNRAALITQGKLDFVGTPDQVAKLYNEQNETDVKLSSKLPTIKTGAEIINLTLKGPKKEFDIGEKITLVIEAKVEKPVKLMLGLQIMNTSGQLVAGITSQFQIKPQIVSPEKVIVYEFAFDSSQFAAGSFSIDGIIYEYETAKPIFYQQDMESFRALGDRGWGAMTLIGEWNERK